MNSYHEIDMATWKRKETFAFFEAFDNPSVDVTVRIDATNIYRCAKERGQSFFLLCLYAISCAVNEVPEMRRRIVGGKVLEFARIDIMTPVMTLDETYQQVWCTHMPDFASFAAAAAPHIAAGKRGMSNVAASHGEDYISASVNPWYHFSGMRQADLKFKQSVPVLTWGKMVDSVIPVACRFHHGLLDGLHIGRFFSAIENNFTNAFSL